MKVRLIAVLGLGAALGLTGYWVSKRATRVSSPQSVEKALASAAKSGIHRARDCESYFKEWEDLMAGQVDFDDKRLGLLSDQVGRYPGIPTGTLSAWKILATELPAEGDIDVSFAFGLSDCQFARFVRTADKLLDGASRLDSRRSAARHLGSAVFGVLREVLERPVSRQVLSQSVTLLRSLKGRGWIQWEAGDGREWDRVAEALAQFNARADSRDRELQQKIFKAASFRDIAVEDRKGLVAQLRFAYAESERVRLALKGPLSRIVVPLQ